MNKKIFLLLLVMIINHHLQGQWYNQRRDYLNANNTWILGGGVIDFSNNPVQASVSPLQNFMDSMDMKEMIFASASDRQTGELMFFTDGEHCYDRNYNIMPNGSSIKEYRNFVPQGNCIVPFPGDPDRYYVFSLHPYWTTNANLLSYSVVNMQLNNGLGDIEAGQKSLSILSKNGNDTLVRSVMAVPGNNCDVWVIVQITGKERFCVFHITPTGLDPVPSFYEPEYPGLPLDLWRAFGYNGPVYRPLTIAPDRKTLATVMSFWPLPSSATSNDHYVAFLHHFNADSGTISAGSYIHQTGYDDLHAIAFAPDSRKLFTSNLIAPWTLGFRMYNYKATDTGELSAGLLIGSQLMDYGSYNTFVLYMPVSSLRLFRNQIYFNRSRDTSDGSFFYLIPNAGLGAIQKPDEISDSSYANAIMNDAIALPRFSCSAINTEVVLPLTDTITDLYFDTAICPNLDGSFPDLLISAKNGFSDYTWGDGLTGRSRTITQPGTYWVHYRSSCNSRTDTFIIRSGLSATPELLQPDTFVCEQRFPFPLPVTGGAPPYQWDNGSTENYRQIIAPGIYTLTGMNGLCRVADSINIRSNPCGCQVAIPNAFSPNNDGTNDFFSPQLLPGCKPQAYRFFVYNRWGQLVYHSFDEFDKGWDGSLNGKPAETGSYFYFLEFKSAFIDGNSNVQQKGTLVLIR